MHQIKIYHEAPLQLFDRMQAFTHGDYALVHLLEKSGDYRNVFTAAKLAGREIILDNSAYELGESFDVGQFANWVDSLIPDIHVVPDVIGNWKDTVDAFSDWQAEYKALPGKRMGVLQGTSFSEAVQCFNHLASLGADIIGIPFLIGKRFTDTPPSAAELTQRRQYLVDLIHMKCHAAPIHLLGVALPQEGVHYKLRAPWIVSVDTSNPVVHGMKEIEYGQEGLNAKEPGLLADMIDEVVNPVQEKMVFHNVVMFSEMWRRPTYGA